MAEKGKVVIVGAGVAGSTLALKLLEKRREFILINPVDYFHLNFAAVRAVAVTGMNNCNINKYSTFVNLLPSRKLGQKKF